MFKQNFQLNITNNHILLAEAIGDSCSGRPQGLAVRNDGVSS